MKTLLIIGVSWFVIGFISYVLILKFFPPTPVLNGKTLKPIRNPKWQMPQRWNSMRMSLFSLIGLMMVLLIAPILLSAFVGHWVFKFGRTE